MAAGTPSQDTADLNLRLLRHLTHYIRDHFGGLAVAQIADASRIPLAEFEEGNRWASVQQFETILAAARALMRDDDEFVRACAYGVGKVSGPMRLLIGAISPADAYELGARNMRLISTISAFEPERRGHGRIFLRYRSTRSESRLICLSRHAQIIALPTMWGLPPAEIVEESCIARGDEACGYLVRVHENRRWLPTAVGGLIGGAAAFALHVTGFVHTGTAWAVPLLGLLAGFSVSLQRYARANRAIADDINDAYLQTARDDANARRELFDLAIRQQQWTHLMEQQVAGRAVVMGKVSDGLGRLAAPDRPGPVADLRENVSVLKVHAEVFGDSGKAVVVDLEDSVSRLDAALRALHRVARTGTQLLALSPCWLETEPLASELRARLQAMVRGKDVRASVFAVREAPSRVRVDVALFNRIADALLANAARSTQRGSIVVEIGGTPDMLTLKVSDTSAGMSPDEVQAILGDEPLIAEETTSELSWAAGMWVVARMLMSIGGRLDVRSVGGQGTTFWAHYPVDMTASRRPSPRPPHDAEAPESEPTAEHDAFRKVH
jgi:signal transduction histidine kinase